MKKIDNKALKNNNLDQLKFKRREYISWNLFYMDIPNILRLVVMPESLAGEATASPRNAH